MVKSANAGQTLIRHHTRTASNQDQRGARRIASALEAVRREEVILSGLLLNVLVVRGHFDVCLLCVAMLEQANGTRGKA